MIDLSGVSRAVLALDSYFLKFLSAKLLSILSSLIPNWLKMSPNNVSPGIAHDAIT